MNRKKISASLEDYLEAAYKIIEEKQTVKAVEISRRLNVGRSSVTEALKTLADKQLVNYGRYNTISLTPEGEKKAKQVVLKHNVLSKFLTQVLDVNPEEAQENACRIEHVISDNVLEKMICFIEFNKKFYCENHDYIKEFKNFCEEKNKERKLCQI